MSRLETVAPAKVNLCLYLGERREDGLHELVSLVQPVDLYDELVLEPAPAGARGDETICADVDGPNLAAAALATYRAATGWDGGPQRLTIRKRIPIAAGMGGGSSDAAAALRLAARAAGSPEEDRWPAELAPRLGADVTSLLEPRLALMTGAGERVSPVSPRARFSLLVIVLPARLSSADVYREADRLGLPRARSELEAMSAELAAALERDAGLPLELLRNDLEPAARSLCPSINGALAAACEAGAARALVSGSGPTVFGILAGPEPAVDFGALAGYPDVRVLRPLAS